MVISQTELCGSAIMSIEIAEERSIPEKYLVILALVKTVRYKRNDRGGREWPHATFAVHTFFSFLMSSSISRQLWAIAGRWYEFLASRRNNAQSRLVTSHHRDVTNWSERVYCGALQSAECRRRQTARKRWKQDNGEITTTTTMAERRRRERRSSSNEQRQLARRGNDPCGSIVKSVICRYQRVKNRKIQVKLGDKFIKKKGTICSCR